MLTLKKQRLEEKQRAARKIREKELTEWAPRYFETYFDELSKSTEYRSTNKYWDERKTGQWDNPPDLF